MSADILSDPCYPHGTAEGFANGCRGSHCPAPVICREVHFRYQGDYAFRKAIDAGEKPADIIRRERPTDTETAPHPPRRTRTPRMIGTDGLPVPATEYQRKVKELVTVKRMTDRQVADALGKTRDQAAASRKALGLPANRSNRAPASTGASSFQESA